MPKKESSKIDRDELIEALTEKRVIEAQVKCFMESLTSAIEMAVQKRMKPIEDALDDKVGSRTNYRPEIEVAPEIGLWSPGGK